MSNLAQDFADVARGLGLNERDLEEDRRVIARVGVIPEALALAAKGVTAMQDATTKMTGSETCLHRASPA